jgi:hypothetical protein
MKQLHKVKFKISDIVGYRKYLYARTQTGEILHHQEIEECGGFLKSLLEVSEGIYEMILIVDTKHPKFDDLGHISKNHGFQMELIGMPKVDCYELKEIAGRVLEEQAA